MIEYKVLKVIRSTPHFFRKFSDELVLSDLSWVEWVAPSRLNLGEILVYYSCHISGSMAPLRIFLRESGEFWTSGYVTDHEMSSFLSEHL